MRVLMITSRFAPSVGGVESYTKGLSQSLLSGGHQVTVLTTNVLSIAPLKYSHEPRTAVVNGINVVRCVGWPLVPWISELGVMSPGFFIPFAGQNFDVVHMQSYGYPSTIGPLCSPYYSKSVKVVTAHSTPDSLLPRELLDRSIGYRLLRRADAVVALTSREAKFLANLVGLGARIEVIPNGIDVALIRRCATNISEERHASEAWPRHVIYVGRVAANKGLHVLLQALRLLSRFGERLRLKVIGPDFGEVARLRALSEHLGLTPRVDFTGPISEEDIFREMAQAQCLVLPSLSGEAQGRVLLEAMAAGCPVIATAIGGVPETLLNGVAGTLVPPGDPERLAEAIKQRFVKRFNNGEQTVCRQWAAQHDWTRIGYLMGNLYESLAKA